MTEGAFGERGGPAARRPRLCFVGPMLGERHGFVTSQGLVLSRLFRAAGYEVTATSSSTSRVGRLAGIAWTLVRYGRSFDVVVVEIYGGRSFVVEDVATWLAALLGCRVVAALHGGNLPEFTRAYPRWSRRVLGRAHAVTAPSAYLAAAGEAIGLRADVIPNVIRLEDYAFRHRPRPRPRLLWMRTMHPLWNPLMAVRALAALRRSVPDASLVMAGQDKGMLAEVKAFAASLGLEGAVRFPGFLDAEAKAAAVDECDLFITTNHVDNAPVAVVEACAAGLPVVATAVGGIPDLLSDGETGLLVGDDDEEAMAAALLRLLRVPELASTLSANGRRLAERSSWERVRRQWEAMFAGEALPATSARRRAVGEL